MFPRSAEAEMLSRMRRDADCVKLAPDLTVTAKAPKPVPVVTVALGATKVCACCGKTKSPTMFKVWPKSPDGLTSLCNTCATKARRERQRARQAAVQT